jgi:hypothetical protein
MYYLLALIILMEAENQSPATQIEVARTALSIAEYHKVSLRQSLQLPGVYSWQWDKKNTKLTSRNKEKIEKIVNILRKHRPKASGRIYMNHRRLGKRFKTKFKLVCKEQLCFY